MAMRSSRPGGMGLLVVVAAGVIVADRVAKILIAQRVALDVRITVIDHLLWITHVRNRGAAFGLLTRFTPALLVVSLLVAGLLIYYYRRTPAERLETRIAIALIFGGALANAYDRGTAGSVVDFIQVPHWPVFNLADSAITIGVTTLVAAALLRSGPLGGRRLRRRGLRESAAAAGSWLDRP